MNHVRIDGDPFGDGAEAGLLRSFLRHAIAGGMRCSLSLSALRPRAARTGERSVPLTDGVRNWSVPTQLPPAEVELLVRTAGQSVHATAPLVVFAAEAGLVDAARLAALEWPKAATVIRVQPGTTAPELLTRLRAELRWAGSEQPPHSLCESELRPWLSLADAPGDGAIDQGPIVHVATDPFADGTDLVLDAYLERFAGSGRRLRLILPGFTEQMIAGLRERSGERLTQVEMLVDAFSPEHARDASVILLPCRQCATTRTLVLALASGRPVCASRFEASAAVLDGRGIVHAIGGRNVADDPERGAWFAPHPQAIVAAIERALAEPRPSTTGLRARGHVIAELTGDRPAGPPPLVAGVHESRPTVVLEASMLENSSTAELTLATAEALVRRGNVDLRLLPSPPFRQDLAWLRARAPSLEPLLCATPGRVDLWLSAGWPVRATRPDCRSWALRIDWEYGALPVELTPHATQDADVVIVHSLPVHRTMTAAGRPMSSLEVVPHGVDAAMHSSAEPAAEIVRFKNGRPAVLFCGGLVWRKGFDVFLRAVLATRAAGHDFVVVVKSIGSDQHYGQFHLGGLLQRFRDTAGTPPLLVIDEQLSRGELASVYTACDVLLHPYRGEGFCMPVLEARACGLPVIATAGGATDALMAGPAAVRITSEPRAVDLPGAHVSTPWVLEPSPVATSEALARTLADLLVLRRAAVEQAPAVRAAFSWDVAAASIEKLALAGKLGRRVTGAVDEATFTLPASPARTGGRSSEPALR